MDFSRTLTVNPLSKGGFPLSCNFYARTHVNKMQAMYRITCTRGLSYIASILFPHVNFKRERTYKLGESGSPPKA